ncbi:hypothetical protein HGRIS_001921 [Hohenbuehelia grisea]|uniref:J domain-containing protein n=1 Tax=Hohenbuehelia grisea TaxID=104357 RepID=A0ABR3JIW3_9AGAR
MVSSSAHVLMSIAGWSIIPDLATKQVLGVLNNLLATYLSIPAPQPGSQAYAQRYRYTFAVVVLGYLTYTLIQGASAMQPNFYQILGISPTVDENGLKSAFKQFARKYHPDRVGPAGEEMFIAVREMVEALKNPVVRFAYDRFGPDVLLWEQCTTTREYLRHGLMQSSGYHIVAFVGLQFWSSIGEPSPIAYWRYLLYATLFVAELALLLSPSPAPASIPFIASTFPDPTSSPSHRTLLHVIFPERVAFQHVLFLHQLFVFLSVALSRVAPRLFPEPPKVDKQVVEHFAALASATDREASLMVHTELHSIHPLPANPLARATLPRMRPCIPLSPDTIDVLSKEMEKMIIEMNVKKDIGPIRSAWETAIIRGRAALSTLRGPNSAAKAIAPAEPQPASRNFWENPLSAKPKEDDGVKAARLVLPSPRPSPPPAPGLLRRGSTFVRARSVSC